MFDRQRAVVELRKRGLTFDAIAAAMKKRSEELIGEGKPPLVSPKYTKTEAFHDLDRALKAARERFELDAEGLRQVEVYRAESAYEIAWSFASDKALDAHVRMAGIDRALRAQERIAQLRGLDAPVKVDIYGEAKRLEALTGIPSGQIVAEAKRLAEGSS